MAICNGNCFCNCDDREREINFNRYVDWVEKSTKVEKECFGNMYKLWNSSRNKSDEFNKKRAKMVQELSNKFIEPPK